MAWHTHWCMANTARHPTAIGDIAGENVADLDPPDERLVTRIDTSAAVIRHRAGLKPISAEDFATHFGRRPSDNEG
jgi:hypothetical protein